jgi:hypothetical protein
MTDYSLEAHAERIGTLEIAPVGGDAEALVTSEIGVHRSECQGTQSLAEVVERRCSVRLAHCLGLFQCSSSFRHVLPRKGGIGEYES